MQIPQDKLYFKPKTVTRDEEGYYIIIKESIQQEDVIINILIYISINYKHKKLLDNKTILVGDLINIYLFMRDTERGTEI